MVMDARKENDEMKLKCYYAHCLAIYNTYQEERDVKLLESLGFEVVNPNSSEYQKKYETEGMLFFKELAQKCNVIAFRALPSGEIPAGVAGEIDCGLPIIELPSGISRRKLSVEQTREYLREVGQR